MRTVQIDKDGEFILDALMKFANEELKVSESVSETDLLRLALVHVSMEYGDHFARAGMDSELNIILKRHLEWVEMKVHNEKGHAIN